MNSGTRVHFHPQHPHEGDSREGQQVPLELPVKVVSGAGLITSSKLNTILEVLV